MLINIYETFSASLRSVGTACTLAAVGIYLHQRNFIVGDGKRTLALISQQVTIPFFLFSKIVYCNQDWSDEPCPNITQDLGSVWMLLLWPAYVVTCGFLVGLAVSHICGTPPHQIKSVLAACAFGNSTGLPITLLAVIHAGFSNTTELGKIDPTLFLSVYLLLFPVLQWGIGGWLLAPDESSIEEIGMQTQTGATLSNVLNDKFMKCYYEEGRKGLTETDASLYISDADLGRYSEMVTESEASSIASGGVVGTESGVIYKSALGNVLNNKMCKSSYYKRHRGMGELDASLYISDADLAAMGKENGGSSTSLAGAIPPQNSMATNKSDPDFFIPDKDNEDDKADDSGSEGGFFIETKSKDLEDLPKVDGQDQPLLVGENSPLLLTKRYSYASATNISEQSIKEEENEDDSDASTNKMLEDETIPLWETLHEVGKRCLQPPVVGAVLGLVVASTPLRGLFVDLVDRADKAPLEWIFDGIYSVGQAAVPLNMIILGCNLSASQGKKEGGKELIGMRTMSAMVIGKMVVMPIIGIASCVILKEFFWNVPEDIDAPFYLVAMIVFITPTANNVMVMVELSGSGTKEGIARVIGFQYLCAPILLSLSVTLVVAVASMYQDHDSGMA